MYYINILQLTLSATLPSSMKNPAKQSNTDEGDKETRKKEMNSRKKDRKMKDGKDKSFFLKVT
jgi:hypothetical protein